MKFAKWGNSVAIRIPAAVVEELKISPDEKAQIRVTGENSFEIIRDRSRQEAMEKLRKLRFALPDDYVFNRDEIYDN